jgi:hypothetical protein
MLPALLLSVPWWSAPERYIAFGLLLASWGPAASNAALLAWNIKRHVSRQVAAEVFLLGGYVPNAAFALVLFFPFFGGPSKDPNWDRHIFVFTGWDIGAYVVLAASIGYVAKIAVLLKSAKSVQPEGKGDGGINL